MKNDNQANEKCRCETILMLELGSQIHTQTGEKSSSFLTPISFPSLCREIVKESISMQNQAMHAVWEMLRLSMRSPIVLFLKNLSITFGKKMKNHKFPFSLFGFQFWEEKVKLYFPSAIFIFILNQTKKIFFLFLSHFHFISLQNQSKEK